MIRKQLLIGILAAMTAALPAVAYMPVPQKPVKSKAAMKTRCPVIKEPVSTSRDITEFRKNDRPNLCGSQWGKYYVQSHKP